MLFLVSLLMIFYIMYIWDIWQTLELISLCHWLTPYNQRRCLLMKLISKCYGSYKIHKHFGEKCLPCFCTEFSTNPDVHILIKDGRYPITNNILLLLFVILDPILPNNNNFQNNPNNSNNSNWKYDDPRIAKNSTNSA